MAGSTPRVITRVKAPRGAAPDATTEDDGDVVGAPERQLVADGLLKPRAAGGRSVKHARVGQFELAEGRRVAVAAAAVGGVKR
jgi:hypothetical protein